MITKVAKITRDQGLAFTLGVVAIAQQDAVEQHIARAKAAAGKDYTDLFDTTCGLVRPSAATPPQPAVAAPGPPARATWHAEPVKVFDNL